ncbi:unnamed protein product [Pedinophyceae sp. YPF-701]|nr:unnamed protein product [Pedinophyceae sp. YPF-701]
MLLRRDFFAIVLSIVTVYISLQGDGVVSFRPAWFHPLEDLSRVILELEGAGEALPRPVSADLNGDGYYELVVATHDNKLQVINPKPASRGPKGGYAPVEVLKEIEIEARPGLSAKDPAFRPVTIATGYIDPPSEDLVRALRKQVVVVVTAGYKVLCYDHNLRLLWTHEIARYLPRNARFREAAAVISEQRIRGTDKTDRGSIVIAASLELGAVGDDSATGGGGDALNVELMREQIEKNAAGAAGLGGANRRRGRAPLQLSADKLRGGGSGAANGEAGDDKVWGVDAGADVDDDTQRLGADTSRQTAFYAFEGGKGVFRWSRDSVDYHRITEGRGASADMLEPQQNYKLTAEALVDTTVDQDCSSYRESLLIHALPHRWTGLYDTQLHLAHFVKHKHRTGQKGKQKVAEVGARATARAGATGGGSDAGSLAGAVVAGAVDGLAEAIAGGERGLPRKDAAGAQSAQADDATPNAIVAHLRDGVVVLDFASGRPMCSLQMERNQVHVDLNSDGVVDHVAAVPGKRHQTDLLPPGHRGMRGCWAVVTSGIAQELPLFNGTICRHGSIGGPRNQHNVVLVNDPTRDAVEVAAPTVLPLPRQAWRDDSAPSIAVFLTSRGEIMAYDTAGRESFHVFTSVAWDNDPGMQDSHRIRPTLSAFPLVRHSTQFVVVAAGAHTASVVSATGHVLQNIDLPAVPVQPLVAIDFDGNGLSDLLLMTQDGLYALAQVPTPGGLPFQALVACLMVAMVAVFWQNQGGSGGGRLRSTERAD